MRSHLRSIPLSPLRLICILHRVLVVGCVLHPTLLVRVCRAAAIIITWIISLKVVLSLIVKDVLPIGLILLCDFVKDVKKLIIVFINRILNDIIAFDLALQPSPHLLRQVLQPVLVLQQLVMHLLNLQMRRRIIQVLHTKIADDRVGDHEDALDQLLLERLQLVQEGDHVGRLFLLVVGAALQLQLYVFLFFFFEFKQVQQLIEGHFFKYVV